MYVINKELIETIVHDLSTKYEADGPSFSSGYSKEELVSKLIIAETTIHILKEKITVLEWENRVWNSSDSLKVSRP